MEGFRELDKTPEEAVIIKNYHQDHVHRQKSKGHLGFLKVLGK